MVLTFHVHLEYSILNKAKFPSVREDNKVYVKQVQSLIFSSYGLSLLLLMKYRYLDSNCVSYKMWTAL